MKYKKSIVSICSAVGFVVLILDAKATARYAYDGVMLCLRTLIPSLFPFLVLSVLLNQSLPGLHIPGFRLLGRLCGIPKGGESILLLGFLGGYPVGASSIYGCYRSKAISKQTAHRLLGFCSNAGPAFIFGITSTLFQSSLMPWFLWAIHMLSALFVGMLLPHKDDSQCKIPELQSIPLSEALKRGISIMAGICGWVVLFRVFIGLCNRWLLWLLPSELQCLVTGILELSNGCTQLNTISSEPMRYILCACMLSFGGLCVGMQTMTATAELGTGAYFPGKLMQLFFSFILAYGTQLFLFERDTLVHLPAPVLVGLLLGFTGVLSYTVVRKKDVAIT